LRRRLRRDQRVSPAAGSARAQLRAAVKAGTSAYPPEPSRRSALQRHGATAKSRYRAKRSSLKTLALAAGREALQKVSWREGSRGKLSSRFLALRVRPANVRLRRAAGEDELPLAWLLCEWPDGDDEPVKYWLSNLPAETPLERLVSLAKLRWRIEQDYRELKDALGLDHFEAAPSAAGTTTSRSSRSHTASSPWNGSTQKRLRRPDPLPRAARAATARRLLDRRLPNLQTETPPPHRLSTRATRTHLTEHY